MPTDRCGYAERNTSVKVVAKLSKYMDLETEITRMWGLKIKNVPEVIGALGLIKKGLEEHIKKKFLKTSTLGTYRRLVC